MKLIQIDHQPSRKQLNVFGILWLIFFGVVGGIVLSKSGSQLAAGTIWGFAVGVPVVGWLVPSFMRIAYLGMAYAAYPIGFVISQFDFGRSLLSSTNADWIGNEAHRL